MSEHKCILRHVKILDQAHAGKATAHNYDRASVPNADQEAPHPTIEFINTEKRDYWEVATERIAEAGIKICRHDQIRCEEILLTASPEWFKRDEQGRALDMSDSQWLKDIRTFLTDTFGEKNLVAFQLQQDEKSPHIHALVVPITADGRLSCKDVFRPSTLREYQTKFAEAMKPHGLIRGVEHSQAEHQPMKQMYGQQNKTAAELDARLGPANSYQDVQAKPPKQGEDLEQWAVKTTVQVNEQARKQVEAANERTEKARNLALENASAREQVRVLQKQLGTSEELKEKNYKLFKGAQANVDSLTKHIASGDKPSEKLLERGNRLLDEDMEAVRKGRAGINTLKKQADQAEQKGNHTRVAELRDPEKGLILAAEKRQKELVTALRSYGGGRTRLTEEVEKRKKEQERAESERQKPIIRENERQEIEQKAAHILKTGQHISHVDEMTNALQLAGVEVRMVDDKRRFKLTGCENEFGVEDIRPGGMDLKTAVGELIKTNNARIEQGKENDDRGRE